MEMNTAGPNVLISISNPGRYNESDRALHYLFFSFPINELSFILSPPRPQLKDVIHTTEYAACALVEEYSVKEKRCHPLGGPAGFGSLSPGLTVQYRTQHIITASHPLSLCLSTQKLLSFVCSRVWQTVLQGVTHSGVLIRPAYWNGK